MIRPRWIQDFINDKSFPSSYTAAVVERYYQMLEAAHLEDTFQNFVVFATAWKDGALHGVNESVEKERQVVDVLKSLTEAAVSQYPPEKPPKWAGPAMTLLKGRGIVVGWSAP